MLKNTLTHYLQKQTQLQIDTGYFHERSFFALLACTGLAAWGWVVFQNQQGNIGAGSVILLIGGIFGLGLIIYRAYQRSHLLATYTFLFAQIIYIASMQLLLNDSTIAALFILVVVMAGALIGPLAAFVWAGLVIMVQMGVVFIGLGGEAISGLSGFVIQIALTALVSWLAGFGISEALAAAETSAHQAQQHAQEARRHRAELKRALKSLDLVNYQLERANHELFQSREVIDAALQFKRKFAAQISHELLTSLNLIFGFSETIAFAQHTYGAPLPKAYLRDVTEIHRNSRHLLALIDDILDLSKLEAGQLGLHCEPVDPGIILHEAIDIVRPLLKTKGLSLRQEITPTLPQLMLDSARIRQVLLNLLSNAARVTTSGGIVVQAAVKNQAVIIEVQDTGPGIPKSDLQRIFEEFQQSDGVAGAAGLGLAVSKQLVNLHGGRMWVESEVGVGSTFYLSFPVLAGLVASPVRPKPIKAAETTEPAFVILGERDSDEVKLLQRHLEGFELIPAPTWVAVRDLIPKVGARAVVATADTMPNAEAFTLPIPIITCDLPGPQKAAQVMDIADYIRKPVTQKKLEAVLGKVAPTATSLLIVDDEPAAVRLIKRLVQAGGSSYQVAHAYGGEAAWEQIQKQKPEVVLLDLAMPKGDGRWLIRRLKNEPAMADIIVVAISGQVARETFESGPICINSKSFTASETLAYLRALLATTPPVGVSVTESTTAQPSPEGHPG